MEQKNFQQLPYLISYVQRSATTTTNQLDHALKNPLGKTIFLIDRNLIKKIKIIFHYVKQNSISIKDYFHLLGNKKFLTAIY
jgi:hypothetical protein